MKIRIKALSAVMLSVMMILSGCDKAESFRTITVMEVSGDVTVDNNGKKYAAYQNMNISDGYSLDTSTDSYSRLVLDSDKYIKLEEESRAVFEDIGSSGGKKTTIVLEKGSITNEITQPLAEDEEYVVHTPNAVLSVRGTFFRVGVVLDENNKPTTDILTYGGAVTCNRVMPDGKVVEEEVKIDAGYKAKVCMDTEHTFYAVETAEGEIIDVEEATDEELKEAVVPIEVEEIPEEDLVEMYVAADNGHEMFISKKDIWTKIEEKEIDIEEYSSKYDNAPIEEYDPAEETSVSEETTVPEETSLSDETTIPDETAVPEETTASAETTVSEITTAASETTTVPEETTTPEETTVPEETTTAETEVTEHVHTTKIVIVSRATCSSSGKRQTECTVCGEILSTESIEKLDHTSSTEPTITAATCTATGSKDYLCTVCGEILSTETIEKLDHTPSTEPTTTEATCTEDGLKDYLCTVCGTSTSSETIPATGHTNNEWTISDEGDCQTLKKESSKCEVCGEISERDTTEYGKHVLESDVCSVCSGNYVELNSTNFPDATFLEYVSDFDNDSDGYLSESEISSVTTIDVSNMSISDLTGIEKFSAMTELDASNTNITGITLTKSNCPGLEIVRFSGCSSYSGETFRNFAVKELYLDGTSMSGVTYYGHATLEHLDLSNCTGVNLVQVSATKKLTYVELEGCTGLTQLHATDITQSCTIHCPSSIYSSLSTKSIGNSPNLTIDQS